MPSRWHVLHYITLKDQCSLPTKRHVMLQILYYDTCTYIHTYTRTHTRTHSYVHTYIHYVIVTYMFILLVVICVKYQHRRFSNEYHSHNLFYYAATLLKSIFRPVIVDRRHSYVRTNIIKIDEMFSVVFEQTDD